MEKFEQVKLLGKLFEGQFFKAWNPVTNEDVLVQKSLYGLNDPISFMDDMQRIFPLNHPNILRLLESFIVEDEECVCLVFEYFDMNLGNLNSFIYPAENDIDLPLFQILLKQTLQAVHYFHALEFTLPNLDQHTILIDTSYGLNVKIGIGMAPVPLEERRFPTDIWSVGRIFARMAAPATELSDALFFSGLFTSDGLSQLVPDLNPVGVYLLSRILCLDPASRITAAGALLLPFFADDPVADPAGPVADPVADQAGPVADPVADQAGPVADQAGPVADPAGPVADPANPVADLVADPEDGVVSRGTISLHSAAAI